MRRPAPPKPEIRKSLTALVQAAAAGRADLAWLDKAIQKAGYCRAGDSMTRQDVRLATKTIVDALVDAETTAETPCCKECLHRAIDALTVLAAGK